MEEEEEEQIVLTERQQCCLFRSFITCYLSIFIFSLLFGSQGRDSITWLAWGYICDLFFVSFFSEIWRLLSGTEFRLLQIKNTGFISKGVLALCSSLFCHILFPSCASIYPSTKSNRPALFSSKVLDLIIKFFPILILSIRLNINLALNISSASYKDHL